VVAVFGGGVVRYAEGTEVSVSRSKAEIEELLMRYGADQFVSGWESPEAGEGARAVIGFRAEGRNVRFELPLPRRDDQAFSRTPTGRQRKNPEDAQRAWEQAQRQRWRALALVVKAKLEAVETGITTFEEEFLAHIVIPGSGKTIGEWIRPQVEAAYVHGKAIKLLPGATS
jgi:hypothetical protein